MIEKITDDKYLYQGRVVDEAFLEQRIAELEQLIKSNEEALGSIKLIEIIPEIENNPEYLEAARMYNEKTEEQKIYYLAQNHEFQKEINSIKEII